MKADKNDMRREYDFSKGERGRYADRFGDGSNVIILDPDIAAAFKSEREVNQVLRDVLRQRESSDG